MYIFDNQYFLFLDIKQTSLINSRISPGASIDRHLIPDKLSSDAVVTAVTHSRPQ